MSDNTLHFPKIPFKGILGYELGFKVHLKVSFFQFQDMNIHILAHTEELRALSSSLTYIQTGISFPQRKNQEDNLRLSSISNFHL